MTPLPKCYISVHKPPEKTTLPHPFNHLVDLLLPTDLYQLISNDLESSPTLSKPLLCHRMSIPLSAIVEAEFLTKYIKTGNVIMLSRGRIDIDNVFSLNDGILRLSLTKEAYEKTGLTGQPTRFGNTGPRKKHNRHLVEINLRDPAMLHGKKGFDRVVWSFQNKLNMKVDFLFCDLDQQKNPIDCPILAALGAAPRQVQVPEVTSSSPVKVPSFDPPPGSVPQGGGTSLGAEYNREVWRDWAMHVYEWLALANWGPADRVIEGDNIDSYLSTYAVDQGEFEGEAGAGLTRVRFRGMIPAGWILGVWKAVEKLASSVSVGNRKGWFSLTVHGLENSSISWGKSAHGSMVGGENGYTLLSIPQKNESSAEYVEVLTFEVVGSQDEHS
ncbi:unnamed protein product [Tuber melanosporum]|uniref:(Perigord truffle) hypothetical protein n=1 Tax=Tuber melanosporum (strain Mel28) TaxID=656061 RepID=D5GNE0_TUBMM|nr:uncharacterized protein GSTUM_00011242001 [Tuber melanosporum]CAZ86033.1 unnamed protein product [Tuber melanosporum]